MSFGFKYGIPRDSDMVQDVRFLPNPYYDPELRDKTGNDKEVQDYVMNCKEGSQRHSEGLDSQENVTTGPVALILELRLRVKVCHFPLM